MRRGRAGEIEHRRGLVLGLTLAEALLLLLFLLLLALGSEFAALEKKEADARTKYDELAKRYAILLKASEIETGSLQTNDLIGKIAALDKQVSELQAINRRQEQELSAIAKLAALMKQASKFNTNDPPAVLERGLAWIEANGLTTAPPKPQAGEAPKASSDGKHNWPPIIRLSEAEGYFFASGSAELAPKFKDALGGAIVRRLLEIIKEYDVNVIEVIGHTDEQPLVLRGSNLDKGTAPYLQGKSPGPLVSADNAGLGFARAVSVVRVLGSDKRLEALSILPLSGAQVIDVGDRLSKEGSPAPAEARRRIEIRVRRSDDLAAANRDDGWQSTTTSTNREGVLSGVAKVIDADTLEIGSTRIRLWGVDAIESGQWCSRGGTTWDCAAESSAGLAAFTSNKTLTCVHQSVDRYKRMVAKCTVDNVDLGEWLVASGHAIDYPAYSSGAYAAQQAKAREEKKGIWQGKFITPWDWRVSRKTGD